MSFQVGTVAGATDTINAYMVELKNLSLQQHNPEKLGSAYAVDFEGDCTGQAAGGEFQLTFN